MAKPPKPLDGFVFVQDLFRSRGERCRKSGDRIGIQIKQLVAELFVFVYDEHCGEIERCRGNKLGKKRKFLVERENCFIGIGYGIL